MTGPTFSFDDRPVPFTPGQTVGAALWADGVRSWRTTRHAGRPRGLFCGIGVCFDCLVVVDAHPDERACVTPAREGLDVRTQHGVQVRVDG
jgi:predicted molibdopterin-dependent oxidoreductase YjgC